MDAMLGTMTARQFLEWQAYYSLEPFGHERLDWNFGMVAATIANCHRTQNSRSFKPGDFMPEFKRKVKHKNPNHGRDEFFAWTMARNQLLGYGPLGNGTAKPTGHQPQG